MLRARNTETGYLFPNPIVVAGGGGGTAAILNYNYTVDLLRYHSHFELDPLSFEEYHIDARDFYVSDIFNGTTGARGYRPENQGPSLTGAGGGWISSLGTSSSRDGQSLSQTVCFAEGGFDCDRFARNTESTGEADGGFSGGGGECGGGYTGGAVLAKKNDIPGGGGHSICVNFSDSPLIIIDSVPAEYSFNSGDGYVDIVPANCNCSGICAVNETEDTFECFCSDNTTLAQDGFDCYYETVVANCGCVYECAVNSTNIFECLCSGNTMMIKPFPNGCNSGLTQYAFLFAYKNTKIQCR